MVIDNRQLTLEKKLDQQAIHFLCDRRFGIGADGLILLSPSNTCDFRMIYYNADGSESSLCGNGSRCIVAFAHHLGLISNECTFEAIDGPHRAWYSEKEVQIEMNSALGYKQLEKDKFWVDSGSPHYVHFMEAAINEVDLDALALPIRHAKAYQPIGGTNVNLAQITAPLNLKVRTFERGVEGETLSCGTGVTACAYTYLQGVVDLPTGASNEVFFQTPGGDLSVRIEEFKTANERIYLCGPATFVFEGIIDFPSP